MQSESMPFWLRAIEQRPILYLTLITLAVLLPFVNKPFHIDDPMFIWAGEHILDGHVLDFYGVRVTWTGFDRPMHVLNQNPPLASYFVALVGLIAGISEPSLHLAFFVPCVLLVIGVWRLARDHCRWPALAAIIALATPVVVVSSTMIMAEVIMACCWVWAVQWWDRGLREQKWSLLIAAGLIASLGFLAKYPAMNLIPLLAAYTLLNRSSWKYLLALLIPIGAMLLYEMATHALYDKGLLSQAMAYSRSSRQRSNADPTIKMFVAFVFTGGCLAPVLFFAALTWGKKMLIAGVVLFATMVIGLDAIAPEKLYIREHAQTDWPLVFQLALWVTVGCSAIGLAAADAWRKRDAFSIMLLLWMVGTLVFAGLVNWSVNGRTILPMAAPIALLLVRRLETMNVFAVKWKSIAAGGAIVASLVLAMLIGLADYMLAVAGKRAATRIVLNYGETPEKLWFQGHWGFQYYMQNYGIRPFVMGHAPAQAGDVIAVPIFMANTEVFPEPAMTTIEQFEEPVLPWLTTMHAIHGAGFYSDWAGPLPFMFGKVLPERYYMQRVNIPPPVRSTWN